MHLDRSLAPYLAQGPCAHKQFPPLNEHFFHLLLLAQRCLFRPLREAGDLPGSFQIHFSLSVPESEEIRVLIFFDPGRCLNVIYDRSTKRLFSEKEAYLVRVRACHGQRRP